MNHQDSMEARLLHNIFLCRRVGGSRGGWWRSSRWTVDPHPLPTVTVYLRLSLILPLFLIPFSSTFRFPASRDTRSHYKMISAMPLIVTFLYSIYFQNGHLRLCLDFVFVQMTINLAKKNQTNIKYSLVLAF